MAPSAAWRNAKACCVLIIGPHVTWNNYQNTGAQQNQLTFIKLTSLRADDTETSVTIKRSRIYSGFFKK